ncbi:MAG: DAK2 domain-containing protein, partial [Clostridia bacterium]|nr:DAK2 domain-containing protein [Clostridia bacterium]
INGKLSFTESDAVTAAVKLTNKMCTKNSSFVTVIYGEDISDKQADEVVKKLEEKLPKGIEISALKGNQPVYYFIISVE